MDILLAILFGVAGGVLGGLVGVGGGVLFVPALVFFLDESQVRAEATSLLAIVIVAIAGTWRQRAYGNVRLDDAAIIGTLSVLGVAVGVVVANEVSERALEIAFAALALGVAAQLVLRARARANP
jgi:hypothetical protein